MNNPCYFTTYFAVGEGVKMSVMVPLLSKYQEGSSLAMVSSNPFLAEGYLSKICFSGCPARPGPFPLLMGIPQRKIPTG